MDLQSCFTSFDSSYKQGYTKNIGRWTERQGKIHRRYGTDVVSGYRADFNLYSLGLDIDSEVLKQNGLKIMQKLNEFQTAEQFLSWMKQNFQLTVPKDQFVDNSDIFYDIKQNFGTSIWTKGQHSYGLYPRDFQSDYFDKVRSYLKHNTTFDETGLQQLSNGINYAAETRYDYSLKHQCHTFDSERKFEVRKTSYNTNSVEKLRNDTSINDRTGISGENRKRKYIEDTDDLVDLRTKNSFDMQSDFSKNQVPKLSGDFVYANKEEEDIYFAPYEDWESESEYIDEDSLFAKHQREYFEAKRQKEHYDEHSDCANTENNNFFSGQEISASSVFESKGSNFPSCLRKNLLNQDKTDMYDEEKRNDAISYCCNVSQQNEAIDYSVKLKKRYRSEIEENNKDLKALSVYSETTLNKLSTSSQDSQCATEISSDLSEASLERQSEMKTNVDHATDVLINNPTITLDTSSGKSDEKLDQGTACIVKENSGYLNSVAVAKLGLCFPLAQNKVTAFIEKKTENTADIEKAVSVYKTLSKEWLELIVKEHLCSFKEKKSEDGNEDKRDGFPHMKQKKTSEDVIDKMITNLMTDERDNCR